MATWIVRFSGSVEVEDEFTEEGAIHYVKNYIACSESLEYEAEEVEDEEEEDDENLYREHDGYEDYLYDNYVADQLENKEKE